jgi:hypothetical protein
VNVRPSDIALALVPLSLANDIIVLHVAVKVGRQDALFGFLFDLSMAMSIFIFSLSHNRSASWLTLAAAESPSYTCGTQLDQSALEQ